MKTRKLDIRTYNMNNSTESKHLGKSLTNFMNFKFRHVGTKSSVQVAGTFIDWASDNICNNNDDIWTKNIWLNHASPQFKYLVDEIWMHDHLYPICNENGSVNNIIYVGESKSKPKKNEAPEFPTSSE